MASLDATVVGIALPAIGKDFHAGLAALQWVVTAYTLTLAGLLLLGGRPRRPVRPPEGLRDRRRLVRPRLGPVRRRPERPGPDRGAGPAGRRGRAPHPRQPRHPGGVVPARRPGQGHRGMVGLSGVGTAIGPFLGGWLIPAVSWRLIFPINLPLAVVVLVVARRHVPESRDTSLTGRVDSAACWSRSA